MRMRKITMCVAFVALLGVAACDVTTEPKSTVTEANVFNDTQSYEAFLAKLYAGLTVTGQQGPHGPMVPLVSWAEFVDHMRRRTGLGRPHDLHHIPFCIRNLY